MSTTLIEELEQAAADADAHAAKARKEFVTSVGKSLEQAYQGRAARLRQRVAWVREIEQRHLADCDPKAVAMFKALAGENVAAAPSHEAPK